MSGVIPKILVIEDNWSDVYLIQHCLDERGEEYRLEVLPDGEPSRLSLSTARGGVNTNPV